MIAASISSLMEVEGLQLQYWGFDEFDILPFDIPFAVIRQEFDPKTRTLCVMNMGRLNTEKEAQHLLMEMMDYFRLEAGYTATVKSVRPVEVELYSPESGDSFLLGIDSINTTAFCVN